MWWGSISLLGDRGIDLLAIIDACAAAAVTHHVLLRKHNVRAAVGWIGIAWLSPFIGSLLYLVFGINRVARHGARLGTKSHLRIRELERDSLAEANFTIGNSVQVLRDASSTYSEMLGAIERAQSSVALSTYIFRADRAGVPFIDALSRVRARGVEVRVLLDGIGSGYFHSGALQKLRLNGVPCAQFLHSWLPWRTPFLNLRNHKKLLVIDGCVGFTGGRNIGAENLGYPGRHASVLDLHFRIEGPVVRQIVRSFVEDWVYTTGELLSGANWWPELKSIGSVEARGINSGPDEDVGKLFLTLVSAISTARERIRIVTPYFLPDDPLALLLVVAGRRGLKVEIIVPERSDQRIMDWATTAQVGLMAPTCDFFLSPLPFDHSKLMTVDGERALFGSANWDVRSLRLNFEFNIECVDVHLAGELDQFIDRLIERSKRFSESRSRPLKLRDAAARLLLPYL
jgi:cardiolipin synthase A/B